MKIYVINLKRRTDRKESILSQFEKYNITNYEFIEAIDGQCIDSVVEANHRLIEKYGCKLSSNEIACAMSHRLAYEKIIQSGERGIVLEDDAIISGSFKSLIEVNIPNDIDMLFFGYFTSNIRNEHAKPQSYEYEICSESISEKDETTICYFKDIQFNVNDTIFYKIDNQSYDVDFLHGTHAYSPSIDMCKQIYKIQTKIIFASDTVFNNLKNFGINDVNYYAPLNPIVNQDATSISDLIQDRIEDGFSQQLKNRILSETFGT